MCAWRRGLPAGVRPLGSRPHPDSWAAGQLNTWLGAGMGARAAQMCVRSACKNHLLDDWRVVLWQHPGSWASVQHLNVHSLASARYIAYCPVA